MCTETYSVVGMMCDHCAHSVSAEVAALPGVTDVQVDLPSGRVTVTSFLPEAAFAADGWPRHHRGVSTTLPGLGYVGLPGQKGLASSMLRGVGPDAARVVRRLRQELGTVLPLPAERKLVEVMS